MPAPYNPFTIRNRPLVLNGNRQIRTEGIRALEALTDETLAGLFPEDEAFSIGEIEIWENMPVRCIVSTDFDNQWITWTGEKWIKEEAA